MAVYTTGEIARHCGVSVRTVQYYDTRNILAPSRLSEGGRRIYSEADLERMRIICFLREAGLPISSIARLFDEPHPEKVISILLEEQAQTLREELEAGQRRLEMVEGMQNALKGMARFSVESIGDIAKIMKKKNQLRRLRIMMVLMGLPVEALQWASILLWIFRGMWGLFVVWVAVAVAYGVWVSRYYFSHVAYICPECHKVFRPRMKEAFWAYHTPRTRRLTCPACGNRGLCVEIYEEGTLDSAEPTKGEPPEKA